MLDCPVKNHSPTRLWRAGENAIVFAIIKKRFTAPFNIPLGAQINQYSKFISFWQTVCMCKKHVAVRCIIPIALIN